MYTNATSMFIEISANSIALESYHVKQVLRENPEC